MGPGGNRDRGYIAMQCTYNMIWNCITTKETRSILDYYNLITILKLMKIHPPWKLKQMIILNRDGVESSSHRSTFKQSILKCMSIHEAHDSVFLWNEILVICMRGLEWCNENCWLISQTKYWVLISMSSNLI